MDVLTLEPSRFYHFNALWAPMVFLKSITATECLRIKRANGVQDFDSEEA